MLHIETSGTWREMGRQIGESFREPLAECIEHLVKPHLRQRIDQPEIMEDLRQRVEAAAPELLEETAGMAEGGGQPERLLLGYRFLQFVRRWTEPACSALMLAATEDGPLLGRNCDLEPEFAPHVQLCRIVRPEGGPAAITVGFLGQPPLQGLNEHGLAVGGASAHTDQRGPAEGLPRPVFQFLMLFRCRTVAQVREMASSTVCDGKPANMLVIDASGDSVLLEMAPRRRPITVGRHDECDWQACTNFFQSGQVPIKPEPKYLMSAYARYGLLRHRLQNSLTPRTREALGQLLRDIAQPGPCIPEAVATQQTAYSQISEPAQRRMWLTAGHPAEQPFDPVSL